MREKRKTRIYPEGKARLIPSLFQARVSYQVTNRRDFYGRSSLATIFSWDRMKIRKLIVRELKAEVRDSD